MQLKGCRKQEIPKLVADMAKEVGLETKREAWAGTLSGGQKRKLSVGIALIGGSKVGRFIGRLCCIAFIGGLKVDYSLDRLGVGVVLLAGLKEDPSSCKLESDLMVM